MIGLFAIAAALGLCVWGLADLVRAAGHLLMAVVYLIVCLYWAVRS